MLDLNTFTVSDRTNSAWLEACNVWDGTYRMRDIIDRCVNDTKCIITTNDSHLGTVMNTKSETEGKKKMVVENETQKIKKVIFSDPATIVLWEDGTKTVVKTQKGDQYDPEKGLAMACMRKILDKKDYHKWLEEARGKNTPINEEGRSKGV